MDNATYPVARDVGNVTLMMDIPDAAKQYTENQIQYDHGPAWEAADHPHETGWGMPKRTLRLDR